MLIYIPEINELILNYSNMQTCRKILNLSKIFRYNKRIWRKYIYKKCIFYIKTPIDNNLVKKIWYQYQPDINEQSLHYLSSTGNTQILEHIYFYLPEKFDNGHLLEYSVQNGHLITTKWLYNNYINSDKRKTEQIKKVLLKAAYYGRLDILQWFNFQTKEILSIDIMSMAAKNGHLDVVIWMHDFKNYCSLKSIQYASENGFLEVVKWIYYNCHLGKNYITEAMEAAAINGHFGILDWLVNVSGQSWTPERNYLVQYLYRRELDKAGF